MNIEIKKSQKPVKYEDAIFLMEKRLLDINQNILYIHFIFLHKID